MLIIRHHVTAILEVEWT